MLAILARATCLACRRVMKLHRHPDTDPADLRSPCCASLVEIGTAGAEEAPDVRSSLLAEP